MSAAEPVRHSLSVPGWHGEMLNLSEAPSEEAANRRPTWLQNATLAPSAWLLESSRGRLLALEFALLLVVGLAFGLGLRLGPQGLLASSGVGEGERFVHCADCFFLPWGREFSAIQSSYQLGGPRQLACAPSTDTSPCDLMGGLMGGKRAPPASICVKLQSLEGDVKPPDPHPPTPIRLLTLLASVWAALFPGISSLVVATLLRASDRDGSAIPFLMNQAPRLQIKVHLLPPRAATGMCCTSYTSCPPPSLPALLFA